MRVTHAGPDSRRVVGIIRGGIDGIVVVPNLDVDDPVDAWTISTRTPDRLAAAIRAAQTGA